MSHLRTLTVLGLLAASPAAWAQAPAGAASGGSSTPRTSVDQRWTPFLGCWRPSLGAATDNLQRCIVPSEDGAGVRRVTFAGEKEVLSEAVIADGQSRASREKACTGTRMSRWGASGARLLMASTLSCPNEPQVTTTGLSAMVSADQWLDVQTVNTDRRGEQTRVQRFWRSDFAVPASIASVLGSQLPPRQAVPPTTLADVIDASTTVDASVLEAWLSEAAVRIPISRRELVQLSGAKVNARVIDLMVALAYPEKFDVRRQSYSGSASGIGMMSDFYPGDWGVLASAYGLGYGIYGVPYFYGAYGYGQPGGIYFIESGGGASTGPTTHGQVVNGQGYTRVQVREPFHGTATATSASSRSSSGDASGSGGYNAGGDSSGSSASSGASPSGYSGGGGTSTGVTAVPR